MVPRVVIKLRGFDPNRGVPPRDPDDSMYGGENGGNRSDNDNNEEPVPGAGMPVMTGIPVITGTPVIPYMPVIPEFSVSLAHSVNRNKR